MFSNTIDWLFLAEAVENSKNFAAPAPKRKKIRPLAVAAPQH
jgi:hypothetical protein